jgi:lysyl-tRNA synthetase class 2
MAALARLKKDDPGYAERFELYLCGLELANGFSELIDPVEQRQRFQEACLVRGQRGVSPGVLPERFLAELAAVPPSAGIALGLDRLVMLTLGAERIDQVVAFPPEMLQKYLSVRRIFFVRCRIVLKNTKRAWLSMQRGVHFSCRKRK